MKRFFSKMQVAIMIRVAPNLDYSCLKEWCSRMSGYKYTLSMIEGIENVYHKK